MKLIRLSRWSFPEQDKDGVQEWNLEATGAQAAWFWCRVEAALMALERLGRHGSIPANSVHTTWVSLFVIRPGTLLLPPE
jgi:hypothetical protein